jgi:phosphatidylserine/phosphatidylglycerophosphate/cardiolipin synthase-like enzyme
MFSLSHRDIVCGATSLSALSRLLDSGVECRYVSGSPKLHAKVYLFGNRAGVVTSANLTRLGLTSNIKVGVEIRGEPMKELAAWYEALWTKRAEPLTVKRIASLRHETEALRNEYRAFTNAEAFMGSLPVGPEDPK